VALPSRRSAGTAGICKIALACQKPPAPALRSLVPPGSYLHVPPAIEPVNLRTVGKLRRRRMFALLALSKSDFKKLTTLEPLDMGQPHLAAQPEPPHCLLALSNLHLPPLSACTPTSVTCRARGAGGAADAQWRAGAQRVRRRQLPTGATSMQKIMEKHVM